MDAKLLEMLLSKERVSNAEEAANKLSPENSQNLRIVPSRLQQRELDRIKRKTKFRSGKP